MWKPSQSGAPSHCKLMIHPIVKKVFRTYKSFIGYTIDIVINN